MPGTFGSPDPKWAAPECTLHRSIELNHDRREHLWVSLTVTQFQRNPQGLYTLNQLSVADTGTLASGRAQKISLTG